MKLRKKHDIAPHLLSMTATPIPRTLALTIFGDLDLSLLDELPPGRQIPETKIVLPHEREKVYEKVREEIKKGRQAFVICPRINDPDPTKELAVNAKSVKSETERLQEKIFPEVNAFKNSMLKQKKNPRSILHTLCRAYMKREFTEGPWAYCQKTIDAESMNYNARDHQKTS